MAEEIHNDKKLRVLELSKHETVQLIAFLTASLATERVNNNDKTPAGVEITRDGMFVERILFQVK